MNLFYESFCKSIEESYFRPSINMSIDYKTLNATKEGRDLIKIRNIIEKGVLNKEHLDSEDVENILIKLATETNIYLDNK